MKVIYKTMNFYITKTLNIFDPDAARVSIILSYIWKRVGYKLKKMLDVEKTNFYLNIA